MNDQTLRNSDILTTAELASGASRASATPMMEQYIEIKANNPDSLLFYRMGDFYELFFQDAVDASRALGITLTKRGQHMGQEIPMCGVPIHAADDYLQKLIALGFRVAVCEQVEDPAEAKKRGSKSVVRRDVVRLVTPGTLTEEKLLSPSDANYLMTLSRIRGGGEPSMALAWIDISTGVFRLAETTQQRLLADILRIEPRELIVPDTLFHDPEFRPVIDVLGRVVVPQPAVLFDSATAEGRIARYFDVGTLDGFGTFSRAELSAASAAVAYVEKTQLAERPPPERESAASTLFIDPATRANLELVRTLSGEKSGTLLKAIDRTVTSGGARLLAERLMSPLTDPEPINERLDSIAALTDRPSFASDLRDALKLLPDMPRALSRLALGRGGPRDLGALLQGLRAAAAVARMMAQEELDGELAAALADIAALPTELAQRLEAMLADELPLLKRDGGFIREGADAELDEMRSLRDQSRRVIAGLQLQYAEETGVKSLKIKHNNVLGYFIEVSAGNAAALTDGDEAKARFIHRQTMAGAMRFTTTVLSELETKIANAADRALAIELAAFDALTEAVVAEADAIKAAARALSVIDVSQGLAVLAEEQAYCRPVVDRSKMFSIVGGRHPVVEQALRRQAGNPFVANSCDLSPTGGKGARGDGAIWLLTGPNMGGKSTFLRQNALIAILAQMGCYVPAESAHIGIVDRLFSRVGASDDLARGRSTFMVEMVETAAILNQATEHSLVILDEIGRGTATFDGLSIAWAAVEHLHEVNRCRGLFATHFHELTVLSEKLGRLSNATMRVKEWDGEVIFLHEVGPGAADRSYGIQVARLAGLPPSVVARAKDVLAKLEDADRKNPASQLIDDLPLFQVAVRREEAKSAGVSKVEEMLKGLSPDDLSPREALEVLYALKREAG
ncbi:DNA mismatch repair protein MutS [Mycoplana dimorpha]|uniref:DNA mismatch repair protein MutS n=1 Tax=Mycoplana dimorpha TaxID=28320 RepID=A0A2T5BEW1_MYCDI|nr:DNA mismatch repair protein MutS [Mycoplana dimorpha]PTM97531.1 DNA mismatch repair protein MutS [Mycoplana dimorpha]